MVKDLSVAGLGYAQATRYFTASSTEQAGRAGDLAAGKTKQKDPDIVISTSRGSFPILSEIKDGVANAARAINETSKILDKAEDLLGEMEKQVGLVKNYPPYPPGNEERVEYINKIEGLRKQIDALVVPKVAESFPPVFYPQEANLPLIDAKVPSDAAVLAFGEAVQAVHHKINEARVMLRAQADQMAGRVGLELPQEEVQGISLALAAQLGANSRPLATNNGALKQLAG